MKFPSVPHSCDSQDWNLQIWNKVDGAIKHPQNFELWSYRILSLLSLWSCLGCGQALRSPGPLPPGCPAASLHIPVPGACGTDLGVLLQGWRGWRCLVVLCFPWPCHITTLLTLAASVWGVYVPGDCLGSRGLWLEVLRFTGPTNTITTSQGERMAGCGEWAVLLPAGMISSLCRARRGCEGSNACFSE